MAHRELILSEAAKIARTTPDALRGAINRKRLPARKVGPLWVVSEDDLYTYLESKGTWKWEGFRPQRTYDNGNSEISFTSSDANIMVMARSG